MHENNNQYLSVNTADCSYNILTTVF